MGIKIHTYKNYAILFTRVKKLIQYYLQAIKIYTYLHKHTYAYMHVPAYIHMHIYTCLPTYTYIHTYTLTYTYLC